MFSFNIPFLGRGGIAVWGPHEGLATATSAVSVKVNRASDAEFTVSQSLRRKWNKLIRGDEDDYGVVCRRVVTTAGVKFIADCLTGVFTGTTVNTWSHQWGTGTTAEAVGQTSLVNPSAPTAASNMVTGTKVSAISGNNATITSVATITAGSALNITEHGIWLGSPGVDMGMVDRSVFTAIPVSNGDSIQFQYVLTLNAGG